MILGFSQSGLFLSNHYYSSFFSSGSELCSFRAFSVLCVVLGHGELLAIVRSASCIKKRSSF